ncbi:response regulator transcription factor [Anaerocolumna jejuensis]|uniref:response regulator transcription factor n=1 Tax=Anaerocolumna jejuensis TaxID=259063 RepID=UPI003F7C319B
MKLLIVDDDMATVDVIHNSIQWDKLQISEVFTAYNIETAKAAFQEHAFAIVICDIEMPMGSGIDLLKWVRNENYDSEFIFLTCHESFEFASSAIQYNAYSYVIKPFNVERMEAELYKVVQKIIKEKHLQEYSKFGNWWIENKEYVEEGFWRSIFFNYIIADLNIINGEISHRKLNISIEEKYAFVLISAGNTDELETEWKDGIFEYSLSKFAVEVILDKLNNEQIVTYYIRNAFYVIVILNQTFTQECIDEKCLVLLNMCSRYLNHQITCYISNFYTLDKLSKVREQLEHLDFNNVVSKGRVFHEEDQIVLGSGGQHVLDMKIIELYLAEQKKVELLNLLKSTLNALAHKKQLDAATLHSIQQDMLQVVYVYLYENGIQAAELFSDTTSVNMQQKAIVSIIDMLRWLTYMINKTLDYQNEVLKSQSIIEKVKKFIHLNYEQDITRTEVAADVYLTPEYLAILFKRETGINIKDYINQYRLEKAKLLLAQSDNKISDIAFEVGFNSFSYFTTLFKKMTGLSPNDYRKQLINP